MTHLRANLNEMLSAALSGRRLEVVVREGCHLCQTMEEELAAAGLRAVPIEISGDESLEARWGVLVPVLLLDGDEVCHYQLDLRALLQKVA